ncbi:MAG: hypothetical protein ACI9FJ_002812, partial [Alteromonadaceae bacterium]
RLPKKSDTWLLIVRYWVVDIHSNDMTNKTPR